LGDGFQAVPDLLVAAAMLTPFSLASFAASKIAARAARRTSAELVVAVSCLVLIASALLFLFARGTYAGIVAAMVLNGFGVASGYAVNPLQITGGVPAAETGSAISFYQLIRTVAYSIPPPPAEPAGAARSPATTVTPGGTASAGMTA
jgi:hypothetical protein